MNNEKTYMTVLTNKRYIPGVVALYRALQQVNASFPLTVLLPSTQSIELKQSFIKYIGGGGENLYFAEHEEINIELSNAEEYEYWKESFFKLTVMNCTRFKKIVLLDSDMFITANIDELFEKPHMSAVMAGISARPDWTNFNSGMLVLEPDHTEYLRLLSCIQPVIERKTRNGESTGDQDVFQQWYSDWYNHKELIVSEKYNCLYGYLHMVCQTESCTPRDIKIIHFVGAKKPWDYSWIYAIKKYISARFIHKIRNQYLLENMIIWLKYWKLCRQSKI